MRYRENGYIGQKPWGAEKVFTYCINLEKPTDLAEQKCDCYKKRIEIVYDLELHKIEVCRGWFNYMMGEKTFGGILKMLGYKNIVENLWSTHNEPNYLFIPVNSENMVFQYFPIYEVFSQEFLIKAEKQKYKRCYNHFFAHSEKHAETIDYWIWAFIREAFIKSKISKRMKRMCFYEITKEMSIKVLIAYLLKNEEFKIPLSPIPV